MLQEEKTPPVKLTEPLMVAAGRGAQTASARVSSVFRKENTPPKGITLILVHQSWESRHYSKSYELRVLELDNISDAHVVYSWRLFQA